MKNSIATALLCFVSLLADAQTNNNPGFGKNSGSNEVCSALAFSSDAEVDELVNKILDYAGVTSRSYEIKSCSNITGCFATVINNQQYIVYQPDYLKSIKTYGFTNGSLPKAQTDWQALTILAHEVGHLINAHFYNCKQDTKPWDKELQADEFAGKIIYHMNGSLDQAQSVYYTSIVPIESSMSHPSRSSRLEAVKKGYENAHKLFPRVQNEVKRPDVEILHKEEELKKQEVFKVKDGQDTKNKNTNPVAANEVHWITSIDELQAKMAQNPKKVYMDVYTDWCGWCKKMDASTFSNKHVANYMNANYYCFKFNAERKDVLRFLGKDYAYMPENKCNSLAAELMKGSMSYPTTILMTENFQNPQPIPGYLNVQQIETILTYFGDNTYKHETWDSYSKTHKTTWDNGAAPDMTPPPPHH